MEKAGKMKWKLTVKANCTRARSKASMGPMSYRAGVQGANAPDAIADAQSEAANSAAAADHAALEVEYHARHGAEAVEIIGLGLQAKQCDDDHGQAGKNDDLVPDFKRETGGPDSRERGRENG